MRNNWIIIILLIPFAASCLTQCKFKSSKNIKTINKSSTIQGRWRVIKSEFECPTSRQEKLLNSTSIETDTQLVFKFTDSSFQGFNPEELYTPRPYKLEGDTLTIDYPEENPPFVSKSFIEFITTDKIVLREPRKETGCILVSSFKPLKQVKQISLTI